MFTDIYCSIHGPECTDIFHILFIFICIILVAFLIVLFTFFIVSQIVSIRRYRSRVDTMYSTFFEDRTELLKLRASVETLKKNSSSK